MKQVWICAQQPNHRVTIIGANRRIRTPANVLELIRSLSFRPVRKPVFASDDKLGVAQAKPRHRDRGIVRRVEFGMPPANPVERFGLFRAALLQPFARFPFGTSRWDL